MILLAKRENAERELGRAAEALPRSRPSGEEPSEIEVRRGDMSFCFLLDRENRRMRVIDFRAGFHPAKLEIVQEVAEREGIERIFTVVEREEATTWTKLGFNKEATVPGFYKRSDGYILGQVLDARVPYESGTRIRLRPESTADPADKVIAAAKKMLQARGGNEGTRVNVAAARDRDLEKAVGVASRSGRALTNFSPFGRDVERRSVLCTARGGYSVLVSVELQPCFDNALLETLVAPRGEKETWMTSSAIAQICASLRTEGVVSTFSIAPAHSVELSAALLGAGFRATGCLPGHSVLQGRREAALVWTRKLAEPG